MTQDQREQLRKRKTSPHLEGRSCANRRLKDFCHRFPHSLFDRFYPLGAELLALVLTTQDGLVRHALQRRDRDLRRLFAQDGRLQARVGQMRRQVKLARLGGGLGWRGVRRGGKERQERVVDVDGDAADGDDIHAEMELGRNRV